MTQSPSVRAGGSLVSVTLSRFSHIYAHRIPVPTGQQLRRVCDTRCSLWAQRAPRAHRGETSTLASSLGPFCPKGMFTLGNLNKVRCVHQRHYGHNTVDLSTRVTFNWLSSFERLSLTFNLLHHLICKSLNILGPLLTLQQSRLPFLSLLTTLRNNRIFLNLPKARYIRDIIRLPSYFR